FLTLRGNAKKQNSFSSAHSRRTDRLVGHEREVARPAQGHPEMWSDAHRAPLPAQRATGGGAVTLRGHLERPMVCGRHLERRRPSPQGAGSVYWLDGGATAPTAASGGQ